MKLSVNAELKLFSSTQITRAGLRLAFNQEVTVFCITTHDLNRFCLKNESLSVCFTLVRFYSFMK